MSRVLAALMLEGKWPLIKVQSEEGVRELAEMTKEEVIDTWRSTALKEMAQALRMVIAYIFINEARGCLTTKGDLSPFILEKYVEAKNMLSKEEHAEFMVHLRFAEADGLERDAIKDMEDFYKSRGTQP